MIERPELRFENLPIDLMRKLVERVVVIENLFQMGLIQFQLGLGLFRGHNSPAFDKVLP